MTGLEGFDDSCMKIPPSLLQNLPIRHFVGQAMLESVLDLRKQLRFVNELGLLQPVQRQLQLLFASIHDLGEERNSEVLPDHGRRLEYPLVLGIEPIDARSQNRLRARRDL